MRRHSSLVASKSATASACATSVIEAASAWARLEVLGSLTFRGTRISSASASAAACFSARTCPASAISSVARSSALATTLPAASCAVHRILAVSMPIARVSVASSKTGSSARRSASATRSRRIASRSSAPRSSPATLARNSRTASPSTPRRAEEKDLRAISSGLSGVAEEIEAACGSCDIANSLRRWFTWWWSVRYGPRATRECEPPRRSCSRRTP